MQNAKIKMKIDNCVVILIRRLAEKNPVEILRLTPQDDIRHFIILNCPDFVEDTR